MQTLPSVSLYIRITEPNGKRRYERVKRGRNPQMCGPHDVYCIHFYEGGGSARLNHCCRKYIRSICSSSFGRRPLPGLG